MLGKGYTYILDLVLILLYVQEMVCTGREQIVLLEVPGEPEYTGLVHHSNFNNVFISERRVYYFCSRIQRLKKLRRLYYSWKFQKYVFVMIKWWNFIPFKRFRIEPPLRPRIHLDGRVRRSLFYWLISCLLLIIKL